jgi:hypothetical protein
LQSESLHNFSVAAPEYSAAVAAVEVANSSVKVPSLLFVTDTGFANTLLGSLAIEYRVPAN